MKKIIISVLFLFSASYVYAGDLVNEDSRTYDIEISSGGGGTTHTSIGSSTRQSGNASKGYTIKIKDTGSTITVDSDGDVYIKDGQLIKK